MRYDLLDEKGTIVNVIEWDGATAYDPAPYTMRPRVEPEPEPEQEAEPERRVPPFVSPWQAREALRLAGLLPAVNAHIESLGENHQVYIAWHYADRISRVSPLVTSIAPQFSLTEKMVDDLFATAAGLRL